MAGLPLPSSRLRGMLADMAKPLAKLVKLLTPKRRWAQFSLLPMGRLFWTERPRFRRELLPGPV